MYRSRWSRGIWFRIQEPRFVTIIQTLIYVVCAAGGAVTLLAPPAIVESRFGNAFIMIWGVFALIGGLAGMFSCPTGKWLIEKPALVLCGTALALYAGIITTLQITSEVNRLTQLCFVLIALLHFIARYARIKPYSYEPGK